MLFNQRIYLIFFFTVLVSSSTLFAQNNYEIKFRNETVTPTESLNEFFSSSSNFQSELWNGKYYVLMQFEEIPNTSTLAQIKAQGIHLDDYIPSHTFYASLPSTVSQAFLENIKVRSILKSKNIWKTSFDKNNLPLYATPVYGKVDLDVTYFKNVDVADLMTDLTSLDVEFLYVSEDYHSLEIRIPIEKVDDLASMSIIKSVGLIDPPTSVENERSKANHRSNTIGSPMGRNLTGNGVSIGIWDTNLLPHVDFGTRVTGHEYYYSGISEDHANHVTGTIAGAGWLDPDAIGMAPEATTHNWNCCVRSANLPASRPPYHIMVQNAVDNQNITITNNSYGFSPYDPDTCSQYLVSYSSRMADADQTVVDNPNLMHVFSAGNAQGLCNNDFFTIAWTHKNSMIVGATNHNSIVTSFSSFGPLHDGRIAPTISGVGASVYSTEWDNEYGLKSGTSMSGPGVAGTIAQIYERYKQLYNGVNPNAALIKAIVCNTADDVGNKGPDYKYGFGQINGLKAVELLEAGTWLIDSLDQSETNTFNVNIPSGVEEARFLLTWTDIPGNPNAVQSLVNDLDFYLTNGTDTIYPWILDMNNPDALAIRGEDHINNIIQITVDTPMAGNYTVVIEGETVTNGLQTYALAYQTSTPEIVVTYPFGGEKLAAQDVTIIRWTAVGVTTSFDVEYSLDGGQTWQLRGTYPATQRTIGWTLPDVMTNNALVRISAGNLMGQSDTTFTISPIPNFAVDVDPSSPDCSEKVRLRWLSITDATEYEVLKIDSLGVHTIATTTDTFYFVSNLEVGEHWFAMRALNTLSGVESRRSIAEQIILYPAYDIGIAEIVSPSSQCQLGTEDVVLEITNAGCRTFQNGEYVPLTIDLNGVITQDTIFINTPFTQNETKLHTITTPADFSAVGMYTLTLNNVLSTDSTDANNALTKEIIHQPTIASVPYIESFEANNGYWFDQATDFSSWEWKEPNGSIISSASNGQKVWITEGYQPAEFSFLYSPCFDFSNLGGDPALVLDVNHDLGANVDRANITYSIDSGATWTALGGFYLNQSNGWETTEHVLTNMAGLPKVQFRIELNADGNEELGEGIAIDYFRINPSTSTTQLEEAFEVAVFPNPNFGQFNVLMDVSNTSDIQLTLVDAIGKTVYQRVIPNVIGQNNWRVDTDAIAKGMYFLNINLNGEQVTRKIIVQ